MSVEPGDLIVSTLQPKGVLARVLFEPEAALSDSLSYDITAWALPYVYGLEAYALPERLDPDATTYPRAPPPVAVLERPFAYLVEWKSFADLPFLAAVLRSGIKLRFAEEPFEIDSRRFEAGTLILTRTGNEALGDRFDRRVREVAATFKQPLYRVATAFVTRGADFGSADVPFLKKPRVAVVAGAGISPYAVGEVWHYFDQQIEYPVTLVEAGDLGWLYHYDVLILPSGSYRTILTDERLGDLKAWIRVGGRLVALERAAAFLAGKDGFALQRKEEKKEDEKEEVDPERVLRTYAERSRKAISEDVTGAVFRAHLEKVKNSLRFGVQDMGRGEVIYLLDDPLFRGFWYNGRLLFGNAVFLVGQRSPSAF